VAWFGSGRGVQVSSQAGVSYLSLTSTTPQISPDQQARFTGEAAAAQKQGNLLHTTLTGAGSVSVSGHTTQNSSGGVADGSVSLPQN
jgi:hypothetical protein